MAELRNFDYPLDEAIRICKEFNMQESLAYLYDKAGFYHDAVALYIEVYQ